AFEETAFTSQPAAPTGTYSAEAFLVKNEKSRELLGGVSFKVQEFEPDRMKVRLDLADKAVEGWLRPDEGRTRALVAHVCGRAGDGEARRGGDEPDCGAAALYALRGVSLPGGRVVKRALP